MKEDITLEKLIEDSIELFKLKHISFMSDPSMQKYIIKEEEDDQKRDS